MHTAFALANEESSFTFLVLCTKSMQFSTIFKHFSHVPHRRGYRSNDSRTENATVAVQVHGTVANCERPKPVLNYVKLDKKSTSRALWLHCAHVIRCITNIYTYISA